MDALAHLNISLADRYVIDREVGRGGMATVFLARDIKHNRRVALKVLNPELGAVMGVERFLSEIRVTANLQHPNLLPLFDSGEANGLLYYVMPYVEGESLRAKLTREKQLPVDEAIRLATAMASALDYAHRHGVIHRDLKPENVLLHDGQPLVADFGIALAVSNAGGERVTQTGLSLGTPQYMSPEQATGDRSIDGRTDIYSLGAITYEMLAGESPHAGATAQAIIAKLMTEEPRPLSVLRRSVPPHVDDAVRCALEKLPADRFASAGEFAQALGGGTVSHRTTRGRAAATRDSRRGLLGVAAVASVAAVMFGVLYWRSVATPAPHRTVRFVLDLPADQRIATPEGSSVNLSPDGRTVAYVATTLGSAITRVFVRRIDSLVARPLPGCDGGNTPTFSPDARWVACKTPDDLRKVPLGGGAAEIILTPLYEWQNFTWSAAGEIIVAEKGHLSRVGDKGRRTRFTKPDTAAGEINHATPIFLDDETVAFWVQKPTSDGTFRGIGVTSHEGGSYDVLDIPGDAPLGYVEGHLLVSNQNGSLAAYPVDLRKRRVTGPAITLEEGIVWIPPGGLQARIARDGSLAYIAGSSGQHLALLDLSGKTVAEVPEARDYHGGVGGAAISPDGRRVAVGILRQLVGGRHAAYFDTWIWDIDSRSVTRFTTDGGHVPAWTPDGKRIAYLRSTHGYGWGDAWWAPVDGSAPAEPLVKFPAGVRVSSIGFTPSGKSAVVGVIDSATAEDIYLVDVTARDRAPMPLARTPFREMEPRNSPDGRWLAYASNETGRFEVYVAMLTPNAARVKVSLGGGRLPQWASGGKRLIYTADNGRTMSARLALSNASVSVAGQDTLLVDGVRRDVDPRTDRILVNRQPSDQRIVVVSKWLDEVKPRMTR